jgi:hypothetical protein
MWVFTVPMLTYSRWVISVLDSPWELGIYLALAVALAAFCAYWIRARVS